MGYQVGEEAEAAGLHWEAEADKAWLRASFGIGTGEARTVAFAPTETTKKAPKKPKGTVHKPADDAEAMSIIEGLDHWEWDTHKVTGKFSQNPYTLKAKIAGVRHTIKLRGRFGKVLRWLDQQQRLREGVA